jgi:hypothetical protein
MSPEIMKKIILDNIGCLKGEGEGDGEGELAMYSSISEEARSK